MYNRIVPLKSFLLLLYSEQEMLDDSLSCPTRSLPTPGFKMQGQTRVDFS